MHAALPHAIHAATRGQRVILCTRNPVIARDWIEHARNLRSIRIVYSAGMQAIHFQHGGVILIRTPQATRGHTADLVILDEVSALNVALPAIQTSRHGLVIDLNGQRLASADVGTTNR